MGTTKERRIVSERFDKYGLLLIILGVLILGALGINGWFVVLGYAIGVIGVMAKDLFEMANEWFEMKDDES